MNLKMMNYDDIDLIEARYLQLFREDFWLYRQYIHPGRKTGWFQRDVCLHLQQWYADYKAGKRPILIINTPPQHGKSDMIVDFVTWIIGNSPENKIIFASFSERLSTRANLNVQRIMSTSRFKNVFPDVELPRPGGKEFSRTRELIEFVDSEGNALEGMFRNTTVQGSITGESLDVGIIDDPIKGREQANSIATREGTWEWFTDDFFTRFSDKAGFISIATRWHIDDPIGRLISKYPEAKVIKYAAIAEKDERYRKAGEALFPEHKSLSFLLLRKKGMSIESWESLYQQNPIISGGNLIKTTNFNRYQVLPMLRYMRIFVDTAAKTKDRNDYTVFGLYGIGTDNKLYVIDILRGKWEYTPMKERAKNFWFKYAHFKLDGYDIPLRDMAVESKSAGIQLIQDLKTEAIIPVTEIERATDKYTRLQNVIGYINSGYVSIPEACSDHPWVNDFLTECERFTGLGDTHDDQVDTFIDALQYMVIKDRASIQLWEKLG